MGRYHENEIETLNFDENYCACCQKNIISENNPKAQDQDLCDSCFDELFRNDIDDVIYYHKGE